MKKNVEDLLKSLDSIEGIVIPRTMEAEFDEAGNIIWTGAHVKKALRVVNLKELFEMFPEDEPRPEAIGGSDEE